MNDYTIYCTEAQTKKALELGAPIEYASDTDVCCGNYFSMTRNEEPYRALPTSEQMIGYLEDKYLGSIEPSKYGDGSREWGYRIYDKNMSCILWNRKERQLHSRKEATLAAIDAALEYLLTRGDYQTAYGYIWKYKAN